MIRWQIKDKPFSKKKRKPIGERASLTYNTQLGPAQLSMQIPCCGAPISAMPKGGNKIRGSDVHRTAIRHIKAVVD